MAERGVKRGHKIPRRFIVTALLLLMQVGLTFYFAHYVFQNSYRFYVLFEFLSICCVIYIVNRRGNPSYKIMWVAFILLIPFGAGWLFYFTFGGNRVLPYLKKRYCAFENEVLKLLPKNEDTVSQLASHVLMGEKQSHYLYGDSGYPLYNATESEFYPSGEAVFAAILKDLERAEKYIFLEFFILAEGFMWEEIYTVLKRKLAEGVEVRIIFDDFGSANRQYKGFVENLKKNGIKVSVFNPIKPSSNIFLNNRNHRKIIVIDGEIAYTGGFNIADEYINRITLHGHWMDCGIRLHGEAVRSFTAMFVAMWNFTNNKPLLKAQDYLQEKPLELAAGFVQPYCDGPFDDHRTAEGLYLQMINSARDYIYIATPYLIIDNTMIDALERAAKSGVDIRIICPHIPDKWYVHPVTQYHYSQLLEAGVRIYEYTPGFIHSKLFCVDDLYATVGTVNMDYRSFNFHFECGVWMCSTPAVPEIKENLVHTMEISEEMIPEKWAKRPLWLKAKQFILHIFAPFM